MPLKPGSGLINNGKQATMNSQYEDDRGQIAPLAPAGNVINTYKYTPATYVTRSKTIYEYAGVEARAILPLASSSQTTCVIVFGFKMRQENGTSGRMDVSGKIDVTIGTNNYVILDTAVSGLKPINLTNVDNYLEDGNGNIWSYVIGSVPFDTDERSVRIKIKGTNIKAHPDIVINFEQELLLQETTS